MTSDKNSENEPQAIDLDSFERPVFSFKNKIHGLYELDRGNRFSIRDGK
jgi:hypothetical protein